MSGSSWASWESTAGLGEYLGCLAGWSAGCNSCAVRSCAGARQVLRAQQQLGKTWRCPGVVWLHGRLCMAVLQAKHALGLGRRACMCESSDAHSVGKPERMRNGFLQQLCFCVSGVCSLCLCMLGLRCLYIAMCCRVKLCALAAACCCRVGFNAIYHLTDVPSFVSGEHLVGALTEAAVLQCQFDCSHVQLWLLLQLHARLLPVHLLW
jgi:hypothetical protein